MMLNSDRGVNLLESSRGYNKILDVGCSGCRGLARTLAWMKTLYRTNKRTIIENSSKETVGSALCDFAII